MAVVAWAEGIGREGGRYLSDWCWVGRRRPMPCKKGGEGGFNLLREEEEDVGILDRYLKEGPMMTWASLARSAYVPIVRGVFDLFPLSTVSIKQFHPTRWSLIPGKTLVLCVVEKRKA